jgi:predicted ATPase
MAEIEFANPIKRLQQIKIQHYRSLYDVSLDLKPLTIIIGPNASGKSNLFKSLRFLFNAVAGELRDWQAYDSRIDDLRWYGLDENGERPDTLSFDLNYAGVEDPTHAIEYHASFECKDYIEVKNESLTSQIRDTGKVETAFTRTKTHTSGDYTPRWVKLRSSRTLLLRNYYPLDLDMIDPSVALGVPVANHISGWRFFDVDLKSARRSEFIPPFPESVPPLAGDGHNLSAFLYALYRLRPDELETIIDTMADFIELPQSLLVEHDAERGGQNARYGFIEQPFGENRLLPPDSMSDGTIRLLALLALLLADRTVTLACLEEPDHGLHPRLMLYLADILRQTANPSPVDGEDDNATSPQIIVTTHSPEFMDCFDLATEADYLQVYITERDEAGKTMFVPTTAEEFVPWLEKYRLGEAVRRRLI